jgi:hypothetical protein
MTFVEVQDTIVHLALERIAKPVPASFKHVCYETIPLFLLRPTPPQIEEKVRHYGFLHRCLL